jgi:hypothetical protein
LINVTTDKQHQRECETRETRKKKRIKESDEIDRYCHQRLWFSGGSEDKLAKFKYGTEAKRRRKKETKSHAKKTMAVTNETQRRKKKNSSKEVLTLDSSD